MNINCTQITLENGTFLLHLRKYFWETFSRIVKFQNAAISFLWFL